MRPSEKPKQPPELEILEIGDLSTDRFRGIFRLTYSGDAYIVLQTRVQVRTRREPDGGEPTAMAAIRFSLLADAQFVPAVAQANPLNVPRPSLDILNSPRILFAAAPLVVPMTLRLSNLSLRAIVVLVVSRQKGITLVFKNDPLEKVDVSSSFDGVESVAGFIQREIENQLREAFRSDLPSVIHRLSQKWLSGEVKSAGKAAGGSKAAQKVGGLVGEGFDKNAKIETRTAYDAGRFGAFPDGTAHVSGLGGGGGGGRDGHGPALARGRAHTRRMSARDSEAGESIELDGSQVDSTWSTWGGDRMGSGGPGSSRYSAAGSDPYPDGRSPSLRRIASRASASAAAAAAAQAKRNSAPPSISHDQLDSVPESIESYDPTYGLRPDSIPQHAGFRNYERLVKEGSSGRGLGEVLEDVEGLGGSIRSRRRKGDVFDDDFEDDEDDPPDPGSSPEHEPFDPFDGEEEDGWQPHRRSAQYETIPAVGGGTVTRPRVFHTQSQMRFGPGMASMYEPASTGSLTAHGSPSSATARSAAGGSTASTIGLGRSASFHARSRSGSFGGPPLGIGLAQHFSSSSSASGASSARFPFPRQPPPPSYSAYGQSRTGNSIVRNTSIPSLSRTSTTTTTTTGFTPASSLATPTLTSHETRDEDDDADAEAGQLAFTRPSPVDLLSRSPSSLLSTSFLDEEHLPITLNPSGNDSCAHLATLTSSNQTLSPFTRDHAHVTARSSPHLGGGAASTNANIDGNGQPRVAMIPRGGLGTVLSPTAGSSQQQQQQQQQPVKAVRKRLHRIGSARTGSVSSMSAMSGYSPSASPAMPSSPTMVGATASTRPVSASRSSSIPSTAYSSAHRRSSSAYSSLSPTRYATHRNAPSPFSITRGRVSLASDYGSAMGSAAGVGAGAPVKTAPSELSDYFPPASEVVGSGAREMLNRMGVH